MNIQNRKESFERAVMDQDGIVSYVQQPKLDASGHYRANIDGEMRRVDHLVLLAFVGPCPEGYECRHLDGDPANNHVDNLRWVPIGAPESDPGTEYVG